MSNRPAASPQSRPILRLYIAGNGPGARRALESRERLIAEAASVIEVEVVNILDYPAEAEKAGILATPTLSDDSSIPPRRLVGDISNIAQVLDYFGYNQKDADA